MKAAPKAPKAPQKNVACVHAMKVKASKGGGGLQREMEDRKGKNDQNIDHSRSNLNFNLSTEPSTKKILVSKEKPALSLNERIYLRINEAGAVVRDVNESGERDGNPQDSVICESIIFQMSHEHAMELLEQDGMLDDDGKIRMDKELPRDSQTFGFFMDSYKFAMDQWGAENVIGAYIHLDEYTPHMHVQVVPIREREVTYRGKPVLEPNGTVKKKASLSAKTIFSPITIKQLWKDYAKAMIKYGVTEAQGLIPKGEYQKVATMDAVYEREKLAMENIEVLKKEGDHLEQNNSELKKVLSDTSLKVDQVQNELNLKMRQLNVLGEPGTPLPKANILGQYKASDVDKVIDEADSERRYYKSRSMSLSEENRVLNNEINDLDSKLYDTSNELKSLKEKWGDEEALKKQLEQLKENKILQENIKFLKDCCNDITFKYIVTDSRIEGHPDVFIAKNNEGKRMTLFMKRNGEIELTNRIFARSYEEYCNLTEIPRRESRFSKQDVWAGFIDLFAGPDVGRNMEKDPKNNLQEELKKKKGRGMHM